MSIMNNSTAILTNIETPTSLVGKCFLCYILDWLCFHFVHLSFEFIDWMCHIMNNCTTQKRNETKRIPKEFLDIYPFIRRSTPPSIPQKEKEKEKERSKTMCHENIECNKCMCRDHDGFFILCTCIDLCQKASGIERTDRQTDRQTERQMDHVSQDTDRIWMESTCITNVFGGSSHDLFPNTQFFSEGWALVGHSVTHDVVVVVVMVIIPKRIHEIANQEFVSQIG